MKNKIETVKNETYKRFNPHVNTNNLERSFGKTIIFFCVIRNQII